MKLNIIFYSIIIILFICNLITLFILRSNKVKYKNSNKKNNLFLINKDQIENFTKYISVLQYFMDKAYELIYKDRIFIYSIEAMRVDDKIYNQASKDFTKLTIKLMGSNIYNIFLILFGEENTLFFNCSQYFDDKIEKDEIRKTMQHDIISSGE